MIAVTVDDDGSGWSTMVSFGDGGVAILAGADSMWAPVGEIGFGAVWWLTEKKMFPVRSLGQEVWMKTSWAVKDQKREEGKST
ncbi:hypothetical protein NL676_005484 [Syzygium grande]|nr:hypothetical protein NL676_005484 [Syzygium grande]